MARGVIDDDFCPVSDEMLGLLHRALPEAIAGLVNTLDGETCARLALYCYRRAHLQQVGFAIAAACDPDMLHYLGGNVGDALFHRAHVEAEAKEPTHYQQRRKVTCATSAGPVRMVPFEDYPIDAMVA